MNTIEEALNIAYDECKSNAYFANGFKKGVEFAQRWISVEEELPQAEGKYLVIRSGNTEIEQWKITNNKGYWYDYLGITHWRPINLK